MISKLPVLFQVMQTRENIPQIFIDTGIVHIYKKKGIWKHMIIIRTYVYFL